MPGAAFAHEVTGVSASSVVGRTAVRTICVGSSARDEGPAAGTRAISKATAQRAARIVSAMAVAQRVVTTGSSTKLAWPGAW